MSQRTQPDADLANDLWSPTPLYAHLDGQSFIISDEHQTTSTFAVRLAPPWPRRSSARPGRGPPT